MFTRFKFYYVQVFNEWSKNGSIKSKLPVQTPIPSERLESYKFHHNSGFSPTDRWTMFLIMFLYACLENGHRTAGELRPYQRAEEAVQKRRLADDRLVPQAAVVESGDMLFARRYLFTYLVSLE